MKSIFETVIDVPQAKLFEIYTDPNNNVLWMDDLAKCEPISGFQGTPGSQFRMIPKKGNMVFEATMLSKNAPSDASLQLSSPTVDVFITVNMTAVSAEMTQFISVEVFTFKGFFNQLFGSLATGVIKGAHRKHMEAFKRFAEKRSEAHR